MKRITLALLATAALAVVAFAGQNAKTEGHEHAHAHAAMTSQYMVIAPHSEAQCLQTLDEVQGMGATSLDKWKFGCMDGDHTGYCVVSAASSEEALKSVPASIRAQARAVKMHKFTAAELKSFHEKMHS